MAEVNFPTFLLVQTNEERLEYLEGEFAKAKEMGCHAVATATEGTNLLIDEPEVFDGVITDTLRGGMLERIKQLGMGVVFVGTDFERKNEALWAGVTIVDPANIGPDRISVEQVAEMVVALSREES